MPDDSIQNTPPAGDRWPAPPPPVTDASRHRNALLIVFLVVFIDLLGFGIVLPLLPLYGKKFLLDFFPAAPAAVAPSDAAAPPVKDENDEEDEVRLAPAGGAILGLLMSSFSAMQFFFAPAWGRLSDRIGRRPILLIGLAGSVVFYALFGIASDRPQSEAVLALVLLFVARMGAGVAGATISTAQAVIADSTTPERRKHGMALIGAAFGIGFTVGPLLGFLALTVFPTLLGGLGYLASGLSAVALILGVVLLPETRKAGGPSAARQWFNFTSIRHALATPTVGILIVVFFLATFGFGAFEATLALLNKYTLGVTKQENFLVFAYVGLTLVFSQGLIYRRLANVWPETTFMVWGILLMGLGVVGLGGASMLRTFHGRDFPVLLPIMLLSLTIAVVGFAFLTPSVQALISRRSDPARQGEVLGVNQSASAMARILGPFVGLSLYSLEPTHLTPYAFGGGLVLLVLPLIPLIRRADDRPGVPAPGSEKEARDIVKGLEAAAPPGLDASADVQPRIDEVRRPQG